MPTRILVIEDNPANMELMTYLLNAFGYELLTASDGETGLTMAIREQPDLIICDVHLPQLDGYGVIRVLKRQPALQEIPAIAVTALAMAGDRDKLLDAGFDGYISKPIEPETFIAEIAKFLPAGQAPRTPAPGSPLLLVVCNAESNRARLAPQLGSRETVWADSVRQAVELAQTHTFSLALVDLEGAPEDCLRDIENAKSDAAFAALPLIIFVPSGTPKGRTGAISGTARFLPRTVEPGVLADEIETCLHHENRRQDGDHTDR